MSIPYWMLFAMFIGHALADYPLQGDWLSKAKNPSINLIKGETIWPLAMASHCSIHAGMVWVITGSAMLAVCEFCCHFIIDYMKCEDLIGYNTDQMLHLLCKVMWFLTIIFFGALI